MATILMRRAHCRFKEAALPLLLSQPPPPPPASTSPAVTGERRRIPWWLWPHVLSLEAPLVAVLYQMMLAQAHGIRLPPMLGTGLALACWVVYALDRTLDTFGAKKEGELDVRHAFYFRHRRLLLGGLIPAATGVLMWLALFVIPEGVLWQAAGLALLVALYLASWSAQGSRLWRDLFTAGAGVGAVALISRLPAPPGFRFVLSLMVLGVMALSLLRQLDLRLGHVLPKEFAAALLFAMGCTTCSRFFAMPDNLLDPVAECLLLAALFACNLHGIAMCERRGGGQHAVLAGLALATTLMMLQLVHLGLLEHALLGPARVALGALGLHIVVRVIGRRLSPEAYHVLTDLALLLPLPLAWV